MKRNSWTETKMHGPAILMAKLMLVKEGRKVASLAATRETETADNGKMKVNAPEEKIVRGKHPIPTKRKEVVPRATTRTLAMGMGNLEKEADQKEEGSPKSGGKAQDKNVAPRQMALGTNPSAAPS